MSFKALSPVPRSLSTRLLVYFVLAGLLMLVLFSIQVGYNIKTHFRQEVLPNIAQYLDYMIRDIGIPPSIERAQALSDQLSIELSVQGPDVDWQSHPAFQRFNQLSFKPAPEPYERYQVARFRGFQFVQFEHQGYRIVFEFGRPFEHRHGSQWILPVIAVVILLWLLYLLIQRNLRPVQTIQQHLEAIGRGHFGHDLQLKAALEFEQLAGDINAMSQQIQAMLDNKQQMLLAISHELRSPITRARVNLELLPEHPCKQALIEDCKEMETLISQILESQRLNQTHAVLDLGVFDVKTVIEEVIEQFFADQEIEKTLASIELYADRNRVALLVKNLLDNALKYSSDSNQPPHISLQSDHSHVYIVVEDTGLGMDQDQLQRITDAFYRIDASRQRKSGGYGLGLYLCQLIVNAHQGVLSFSSQPGQGTRVTVKLPQSIPD